MTEDQVASWLISTVRLHGGQLHTGLLVAGAFMADDKIRERFHPDWVAAERAMAEEKRQVAEAAERRRHAPWTAVQRAASERRRASR